MKTFAAVVLGSAMFLAVPVMAQEMGSVAGGSGDSNMEILMQKVKADKKLLIATNMGLSEAEGKKFWPLYDAYQKELGALNQRLGKTIQEYADAYNAGKGTISEDTAKKLLSEALSVEEAEVKLKRTYADKIGKVVPATKTARYIQMENKIRAIVKMELAQQIPLVY
ncbi:hypothetical protein [Petrachloros mirabilis]